MANLQAIFLYTKMILLINKRKEGCSYNKVSGLAQTYLDAGKEFGCLRFFLLNPAPKDKQSPNNFFPDAVKEVRSKLQSPSTDCLL